MGPNPPWKSWLKYPIIEKCYDYLKLSKNAGLSNNRKERSKPRLGVTFNLNIVFASKGPLWGPL